MQCPAYASERYMMYSNIKEKCPNINIAMIAEPEKPFAWLMGKM